MENFKMDRTSRTITLIFGLFLHFLISSSIAEDGTTGNCDVDMWYEAMNRTEGVFLKAMTAGQKMIKEQIERLVTPVGKTSRGMKMPCSMLYKFTTILNPDMDTTKKEVLFMFIKSDDTKEKSGSDGEKSKEIKEPADKKSDEKKETEESPETKDDAKTEKEDSSKKKRQDKKDNEVSSDKKGDKKKENEDSSAKEGDEKKEGSSDKKDDEEIEKVEPSEKKDDEKKGDKNKDKEVSSDNKGDETKRKVDSSDKNGDEKKEKEDISDKIGDETKEKEDSPDMKSDEKKEKEDSTDKEGDETKEKEDSSDKKGDEKKEKEDSSNMEGDETKEKEDISDKKGDEKKEKEDSSDKEGDETKEKEDSSDKKGDEKKGKEDSSDKEGDETKEKEDSSDKKGDETKKKEDSSDKKGGEKKEKEESSDKKGDETKEKEDISDKKDDEKKEKEESSDKEGDETKEKEDSSDKKSDEKKEKKDSSDKKSDEKKEKEDSSDKKSDEKKEKEDSSDKKRDEKKEKEDSSYKKGDENAKEDSSDKKSDEKKEKEDSSDKKGDEQKEKGNAEKVKSPEKAVDKKKADEKSKDGRAMNVDADATDMTDLDDTETTEDGVQVGINDTQKSEPVKEDKVKTGKEENKENKKVKKLSDVVEEMLSDANFCYSLVYYLHIFYLKESELKEITPGNSLMEKVTRECLMCGDVPAFDWLCAQLTFIHKLYTADVNDGPKKTKQVGKGKEEKKGFMERITDTIDDLLDFTKPTPDIREEKKKSSEHERLVPMEDTDDAKKLHAEDERVGSRTRMRSTGAATGTGAQAKLHDEKLRILERRKIRELSEALEDTQVRMGEKTQMHERKIAQLEIEILKVQNKLLTATLNKSNDTATFSKLENYIIKLENEILRMNISFYNLKKENDHLQKKSKQFLMLEDKQAKQKEQETSKSFEVLQKQQDRIMHLSAVLNGQNAMMSELKNRSSQLEEENKTLRDMMAKQALVMSEVLSKLEKVELHALITSQEISDLKTTSMSKTQVSGGVTKGHSREVTESKGGTGNKYSKKSNPITGQNCHNLTSQKGCVYVSMLKGQCCLHQKPEVPKGDSSPKHKETAERHSDIGTTNSAKGDTGDSGSKGKNDDEKSNMEMETEMLKAIEIEVQKAEAHRANEAEAEKTKEAEAAKAKEAEAAKAKEAEVKAKKTKEAEAAAQKAKEVEAAKVKEAIAAAQKAKEVEAQEAKEAWVKKAKEAEAKKAKDENDKKAKEAAAQKAKEAEAQKAKEAEAQKAKEAEAQKAKEAEAQKAKEAEAQKAKKAEAQKAKEAEAQKAKEAEAQKAKEAEAQKAKEAEAQKAKETEAQRVKDAEAQKAKGAEGKKEAGEAAKPSKATPTVNSPAIVNGERILLYQKGVTSGMKDCFSHFVNGRKRDSGFMIHPLGMNGQPVKVWCDMTSGGWTVIQKRLSGSLDFYKSWQDYKEGFGDIFGEHWIGNDLIHFLTNQDKYSLRIDMMDWQRNKVFILYKDFWIDSEAEGYRLHVGGYSGTVGDALAKHNGKKFSTKDVDNDEVGSHVKQFKEWDGSCAKRFSGAWWFYKCYQSNLNGKYYRGGDVPDKKFDGVAWKPWKGPKYSLKRVEIKIRPKDASEVVLR